MKERINTNLGSALEFVRAQTWQDVALAWQQDEGRPGTKSVYAEGVTGDWLEWRNNIIQPLHLSELDWQLFNVSDPLATIPQFHGGPLGTWERLYYGDAQLPTFAQIVDTPGTDVATRDKFTQIAAAPEDARLIGLVRDGEVYIVEGMHRCVAYALAAARGMDIHPTIQISLAVSDLPEFTTI